MLGADVLSSNLVKGYESGLVEGFEVGRNSIHINHLQFADDTLFFASDDAVICAKLLFSLK